MSVLNIQDLRRSYAASAPVLDGFSLAVETGEVVALLGCNGAGKTTLFRCLLGILEPQGGTVQVFGLDPRVESVAVKQRLGYVAEDQVLPPKMRVGDVVELHRDLFPTWDDHFAADLAKRFSIRRDVRIDKLSKGQARQVALLCAVAHRPELLLLDEPAGGLDPAARREFVAVALELRKDHGTTILFSSHHLDDVERMADRVTLLHEGRLHHDAPLAELRGDGSLEKQFLALLGV